MYLNILDNKLRERRNNSRTLWFAVGVLLIRYFLLLDLNVGGKSIDVSRGGWQPGLIKAGVAKIDSRLMQSAKSLIGVAHVLRLHAVEVFLLRSKERIGFLFH